jgi:hypothetical protein
LSYVTVAEITRRATCPSSQIARSLQLYIVSEVHLEAGSDGVLDVLVEGVARAKADEDAVVPTTGTSSSITRLPRPPPAPREQGGKRRLPKASGHRASPLTPRSCFPRRDRIVSELVRVLKSR